MAIQRVLLVLILATMTPLVAQPPVVPGFPNVPQTPGAILSGLNAPQQGRTAIIAYHNGVLFTVPEIPSSQPGADFIVRTWDISDPTNPIETDQLGVTPMPINAHGYFKSGDYLILGSNYPPEAPWSFRANGPGVVERTMWPDLQFAGVRGNLYHPWYVGDTYWSYGEVSGNAEIWLDWNVLSDWDHLGLTGVIGHPFLVGDLLIFASDQSRTGVATYDVSDPTNPVLLDVLTEGGPGGYWPELWGGDGKLYVVFPYRTNGNGMRVVDVTDPTDMQFLADTSLPGDESMYIQFQDEYAFMGSHKVDMRTFQSVLDLNGANTVRPSDGQVGINTSQFLLPLGNLLITGGIGPDEGMAIWAHQAAPDTRGPSVGFHIPQAGRTNYPLGMPISLLIHETLETPTIINGVTFIVRPLGGQPIAGSLVFSFGDVLTFQPDQPLQANTTYEVVIPAGGIKDAAGNGIEGYTYTFSTGSSVGGNAPPTINTFTASAYPVTPGQSASLQATATDPDADPVELRFDFGDGSARTPWSSATSASHTWTEPGHYQVTVQARDDNGALSSDSFTLSVLSAPTATLPTHSAPLVCDDSGRRVFKVNPDNDTVTAIDADTLATVFEVPVCADPRAVSLSAQGELWVACFDDDRLWVLDAGSGAMTHEVLTGYGSAPIAVAASPDGATIYATFHGSGEIRAYDATTRQEDGSLFLGPTPRAIAVTGDGNTVLVTRFRSPKDAAEVWSIDTTTATTANTSSTVQEISGSTVSAIRLPKFGNEENWDTTASGRGVANYLVGITIAPGDQSAWVAANKPNTERGLFIGPDLDQDNTVRNIIARLDLTTGTLVDGIDLDNSDSASAVAFSPLGDYLFVALQGNNEVIVLDNLEIESANGLGSFVTRFGAGAAPQGVCIDATTRRTFVANFMGRSLSAVETDDFFVAGDRTVAATDVPTVASETLSPQVLNGKRFFYDAGDPRMSAEGYMSCASCHLDGGHDGRTWDFAGRGEGFRNTTTLRGRAGMGQGNVHWTANFDEIQDFEGDIRNGFGGEGFMSDSDWASTQDPLGAAKAGLSTDLDALAAYVASLGHDSLPRSPWRNADGSHTSSAEAGRVLFESLGCASCHLGTEFTDSTVGTATLHDVGTIRTSSGGRLGGPLTGFDTPTLLGVWNTEPYLHDGSARTLEDVFALAGGTIIQAEDGTTTGAAGTIDQYVNLNNDDTVHNRAYVELENNTGALTLSNVDGGAGGAGAIEIRYSNGWPRTLEITVNGGTPVTIDAPATANDPLWRPTVWENVRLENLVFTAGTTNTIVIRSLGTFASINLDDVLITTADERALAQPHRQVLGLTPTERTNLIDFLLELDEQNAAGPSNLIFADDFESGDTMLWSSTVP
ncbi:MAG: Ig-like domain-containing protein [Acidobacteriota bacterium]